MEEKLKSLREEMDRLEVRDDIDKVKDKIMQLESQIDEEISGLKVKLGETALEGYFLEPEIVEIDKKAEDLKEFIGKTKEDIEKALLRKLEKDWLIAPEEFEDSSIITGDNLEEMDENAYFSLSIQEEEAEKRNNEILRIAERLSDAVKDAASSALEKINTVEYVMDKYTFLTSRTKRNHYFSKGEVEYIISGPDINEEYSQIKNTEYYIVTKVLLQVWALRFALNTVDALLQVL